MDDVQVAEAFQRWGHLIYRHCRRIVGDAAAEDLTQEVFIRLWERRRSVLEAEAGGKPMAWVYRVATNACLDHLRKHRRLTSLDAMPAQELPFAAQIAPGGSDARLEAAKLLADWDERTQAIVTLVKGLGFTQDEAADILGITRRTVGSRLRAFLAAVRQDAEPAELPAEATGGADVS